MQDRAFRLDFFIAVGALLVSALTAATLVYQTHVIGNQYAATIWPYLDATVSYPLDGESIELVNDGLGPALIRSAQLSIDGKDVPAWNNYFRILLGNRSIRRAFIAALKEKDPHLSSSSIGPSTTLRPGETFQLLNLELPGISYRAFLTHTIQMRFCYCSLNSSCWNLDVRTDASASKEPAPVSQCTTSATINALLSMPILSGSTRKHGGSLP